MANVTVYLKCDRNVEVRSEDVFLSDVGSLRCIDSVIAARLKALKVHHFSSGDTKRCVISSLYLVKLMEETCPNITVQIVGEPDVLVEQISVDKHKGWQQWAKCALVCLVSFFGTAFTIMAYHNDVGINDVFTEIYRMVMDREPQGLNVLEVSYSIGLAAGIILFFNHVGVRRLTKDPTPIEVAMRNYEEDVDKALIATAGREGKTEQGGSGEE
ncbi:stage V sporulation protein AA [Acetatifactor aquisgranensis]|uniref:stage V sporulation protein AA n=1 Tax=Acetatifactor aquisgranensis TaxID=2941233 RepID=UPI00203D5EAF|nr:stage V sporulation protein AA [Acetatifactor aquisgranensis]